MSEIDKQPHVLLFAPYFPPRLRVGAIRPYHFAKYLSVMGWKVTVLCIKDVKRSLTEKQKTELSGVDIIELEPPFDRTSNPNSKKEKSDNQKPDGRNNFSEWFDSKFPLDTWLPFFWLKKNEIVDVVRKCEPDIIWSTSDPWSGGYTAGKVSKKLNIKWVADFRDPWTLGPVRFKRKGLIARFFEKKAESWIVQHADWMTFTAKKTEEKYLDAYSELKGKTTTVYNSFDAETESDNTESEFKSDKFVILFLGTFRELSTAELIIRILGILKTESPDIAAKLEVHSYGNLVREDLNLAREKNVLDMFVKRDKVPHEEVSKEMENADLLLLSSHPERDDIVPAKLWDYIKSGKRILSVAQNPEIKEILTETATGVQFSLNETDKAASFLKNVINESIESVQPNGKAIDKYSAKSATEELAEILKKVVNNG